MKLRVKTNSMAFVLIVAVLLLVVAFVFPMKTSLGQGIDEHIIVDWRGGYNPNTDQGFFRVDYSDGTYRDIPAGKLMLSQYNQHVDPATWLTPPYLQNALGAAYHSNKVGLKRLLGTNDNAPSVFHPFPQAPVAYSKALLTVLNRENINLSQFGGPNIPPNSVPMEKLTGGILQIDTAADGNTLAQCLPGAIPSQLQALNPSLSHS